MGDRLNAHIKAFKVSLYVLVLSIYLMINVARYRLSIGRYQSLEVV